MTEAHHYEARSQRDEGTTKCVLALVLAALSFASSRLVHPLFVAMGFDTLMGALIVRSVLSVASIIFLGGASWLAFNPKNVRRTWRYCRFIILINVALSLLVLFSVVSEFLNGTLDVASAPYWVFFSTVLCIFVGINEEGIFRGLLMGGLLAKLGSKKNGPLLAALVSSLVFGADHVIFDMDYSNAFAIGTGLLKTLETSMFAFILCAPIMEDKNLWGAMTVHAFTDWVILCGSTVRSGGMSAPTYVSTDPGHALPSMILFGVLVLLYLPTTIRAFKDLRAMELPQNGPFIGA